jgi:hypothetical protein
MPVWPQNAAILDRSPSPAAATLFLRWLLEPDQQNAIAKGGAWSPRLDIAPPSGLAPLAELNIANGFPAFITRTAERAFPVPAGTAYSCRSAQSASRCAVLNVEGLTLARRPGSRVGLDIGVHGKRLLF